MLSVKHRCIFWQLAANGYIYNVSGQQIEKYERSLRHCERLANVGNVSRKRFGGIGTGQENYNQEHNKAKGKMQGHFNPPFR
jgi:hypothetical protein